MSAWTSSDSSRIRAERTFRSFGHQAVKLGLVAHCVPQELDVAVEAMKRCPESIDSIWPVTQRAPIK